MRSIVCTCLALLLSCGALADTIYTVDGLIIIGKVRKETPERVVVVLEEGLVSIPRYRIKDIDYDYESRKAKLKDDDYKGRYELALWALEHGRRKEALDELKAIVGKPGVPPEALYQLALLEKEQGDLKAAFGHLAEYLKHRPNDQKAGALYEELKKAVAPAPAKATVAAKPAAGPAAGPAAEPAAEPAAKPTGKIQEGLEAGGKWSVEGWGNKATVEVVADKDGNKSLAILTPAGGNQDKVAVGLSSQLNLTGKKRLIFNGYVEGQKPVPVALALITSDYYESRIFTLQAKKDWNINITLDLGRKEFKCKATNWRFESALEDPDKVKRLIFLVYNYRSQANIYIDSIRVE